MKFNLLTKEELENAEKNIKNQQSVCPYLQIHCGNIERLCEVLKIKRKKGQNYSTHFYGIPVFEKDYLQTREVRLFVSNNGYYQKIILPSR